MTMKVSDRRALEALEMRLRTILPAEYQDSYAKVQPVSMGSAGLKYDANGEVAWNEIWATFCDLAMAGGPPHKGALLEPASRVEIDAHPVRYDDVVREICRGITLATDLLARPSPDAGWIRVECLSDGMADWLVRAIVMENVAARRDGEMLDLPASPAFRLEKEVKNVVTVIAKTSHYWMGHMPREQQRGIAILFAGMAEESALVGPVSVDGVSDTGVEEDTADAMAAAILVDTGLRRSHHRYRGWLGLECASVQAAIWMMRALVVSNVLSRREGITLFVPVNPLTDPGGVIVARTVARIHGFALGVEGQRDTENFL